MERQVDEVHLPGRAQVIFPLYNVEFLGEQWEIIEMEWLTGEG